MANAEFIAAIDLGTSRLVGMVGKKNTATGILSVLATDTEEAAPSIRRGCVVNIEETAAKIKRLVRKLENQIKGARIAKIYIGLGGQSIHSIDHTVLREDNGEELVTEDLKDLMMEECRAYHPKGLDVLAVVPPVYYVNGNLEQTPVGMAFRKIEAKYKLIVGRPSLRRHIENSVERAGLKLADILISPLALADVALTENEKSLGCALIDFGAGTTSVTIYKGGTLVDLCVIPLGGQLITKDLTTLHLVEAEAERLKIMHGSAVANREENTLIQVNSADGVGIREIRLAEVNHVIEARMREIAENVYARLEGHDLIKTLGAGVIITGAAARLRQLQEEMQKRLKTEVRYATLRKNVTEQATPSAYADLAGVVGLLAQGDINCAYVAEKPPVPPVDIFEDDEEIKKERERLERERQEKEERERAAEEEHLRKLKEEKLRKKKGIKDLFSKSVNKIGDLFNEED